MHVRVLALWLCALATLPIHIDAATPYRADDFVESIGVATHLDYDWSEYADFALIKKRLKELGVRYIRDGATSKVSAKLNELHRDLGIKMVAVLGNDPNNSVANAKRVVDMIAFVEGDNEPDLDGGSWYTAAREAQKKLYANIKGDAATRHLRVTSPALCNPMTWTGEENAAKLGDISRYCDYGAMHTYPRRGDPTYVHKDHGEYKMRLPQEIEYCRAKMFGSGKPVIVTETGYHDYAGYATHNKGVPPDVEAKYLPRLFLYYFDTGVALTCTYEFIDHLPGWYRQESPSREYELHFGLVYGWPQYNRAMSNPPPVGTPKPVFHALKNLIALFSDPGNAHGTHDLDYTIENASASLRHMLFQKRDGTYLLALWREVECYDPMNNTRISVASETVRLRVAAPVGGGTLYRPVTSLDPGGTIADLTNVEIEVSDEVMVIAFTVETKTPLRRLTPVATQSSRSYMTPFVSICDRHGLAAGRPIFRIDGRLAPYDAPYAPTLHIPASHAPINGTHGQNHEIHEQEE